MSRSLLGTILTSFLTIVIILLPAFQAPTSGGLVRASELGHSDIDEGSWSVPWNRFESGDEPALSESSRLVRDQAQVFATPLTPLRRPEPEGPGLPCDPLELLPVTDKIDGERSLRNGGADLNGTILVNGKLTLQSYSLHFSQPRVKGPLGEWRECQLGIILNGTGTLEAYDSIITSNLRFAVFVVEGSTLTAQSTRFKYSVVADGSSTVRLMNGTILGESLEVSGDVNATISESTIEGYLVARGQSRVQVEGLTSAVRSIYSYDDSTLLLRGGADFNRIAQFGASTMKASHVSVDDVLSFSNSMSDLAGSIVSNTLYVMSSSGTNISESSEVNNLVTMDSSSSTVTDSTVGVTLTLLGRNVDFETIGLTPFTNASWSMENLSRREGVRYNLSITDSNLMSWNIYSDGASDSVVFLSNLLGVQVSGESRLFLSGCNVTSAWVEDASLSMTDSRVSETLYLVDSNATIGYSNVNSAQIEGDSRLLANSPTMGTLESFGTSAVNVANSTPASKFISSEKSTITLEDSAFASGITRDSAKMNIIDSDGRVLMSQDSSSMSVTTSQLNRVLAMDSSHVDITNGQVEIVSVEAGGSSSVDISDSTGIDEVFASDYSHVSVSHSEITGEGIFCLDYSVVDIDSSTVENLWGIYHSTIYAHNLSDTPPHDTHIWMFIDARVNVSNSEIADISAIGLLPFSEKGSKSSDLVLSNTSVAKLAVHVSDSFNATLQGNATIGELQINRSDVTVDGDFQLVNLTCENADDCGVKIRGMSWLRRTFRFVYLSNESDQSNCPGVAEIWDEYGRCPFKGAVLSISGQGAGAPLAQYNSSRTGEILYTYTFIDEETERDKVPVRLNTCLLLDSSAEAMVNGESKRWSDESILNFFNATVTHTPSSLTSQLERGIVKSIAFYTPLPPPVFLQPASFLLEGVVLSLLIRRVRRKPPTL